MERQDAEDLLRDSLTELLQDNHDLFTSGVNERTITSHLFRYLADDPRIPLGVSVDHEYNRVGDQYVKHLRNYVDGDIATDNEGNPIESARIPDILVHGRGDHSSNLIAVEIKVGVVCDEDDIGKILALTSEPFAYMHGVLLAILRQNQDGVPQWSPTWAWNPQPRKEVEYEQVFDSKSVADLASRGRDRVEQRRAARG